MIKKENLIVVILNKNHADSLERCLNSLINQSFKEFIALVIDGNSTDKSISLLEDFSLRDDAIKFILQKSKGIGPARNEVIKFIETNYQGANRIIWGDSENLYHPDYLKNMTMSTEDIVGGANVLSANNMLGQSLWWLYVGVDGKGVLGHNIMLKFDLYKKPSSAYPELIAMDDYFLYAKFMSEGASKSYNPLAICYVRTVESLGEFVNWHKRKLKGLISGFGLKPSRLGNHALKSSLNTPNIKLFILFNCIEATIFLASFILKAPLSYAIIGFLFPILLLSLFLGFKGRRFVINMKRRAVILMGPLFLYHYWATIILSLGGMIRGKLKGLLK